MQKLMLSDIKNERFLCIGENAAFKTLFDKIAVRLNKKPPTILVKPWLMGITWRLMALISLLPKIKSPITQETARSAFGKTVYSNEKVKAALGFEFRGLDEMVENAVSGKC